MAENKEEIVRKLLDAALPHVVFDGWSDTTVAVAAREAGLDQETVRQALPGGVADLAAAFHSQGDARFMEAANSLDLAGKRYSDKVAELVWLRVQVAGDKEVVRRGFALFALPMNAARGARLVWNTADAIWTVLGDTSNDGNWYSKRLILSGVLSSTFLYWLGDSTDGHEATRAFIDRRIGNVMAFEKFKGQVRGSSTLAPFVKPLDRFMQGIRAPSRGGMPGYPGHVSGDNE